MVAGIVMLNIQDHGGSQRLGNFLLPDYHGGLVLDGNTDEFGATGRDLARAAVRMRGRELVKKRAVSSDAEIDDAAFITS